MVGKIEVTRGRHMNWIRVDRYFKGNWDNPELYYQPVPCMQCENAPCELVCPVAATVHSGEGTQPDGLQPLRRHALLFEQLPVQGAALQFPAVLGLGHAEPVRRAQSERHGSQPRRDGKMHVLHPAHQRGQDRVGESRTGVSPTAKSRRPARRPVPRKAIVFGDINDPKSRVAQLKAQARNYSLLEDLNMRPRTTYLGRLRNPNPEIEQCLAAEHRRTRADK